MEEDNEGSCRQNYAIKKRRLTAFNMLMMGITLEKILMTWHVNIHVVPVKIGIESF